MNLREREKGEPKTAEEKNEEKKTASSIIILSDIISKSKKKMNSIFCKDKHNESIIDEKKKNYLINVDKTLLKKDINCVSYAYKNLNNRSVSKRGIYNNNVSTVSNRGDDDILDKLSLEKKKRKNAKTVVSCQDSDKKAMYSMIYDTFINKNLKIKTDHSVGASNKEKEKKIQRPHNRSVLQATTHNKKKKKIKNNNNNNNNNNDNGNFNSSNISHISNISNASNTSSICDNKDGNHSSGDVYNHASSSATNLLQINEKNIHQYRKNLVAQIIQKQHADSSAQITETNEELNTLTNDGSFLYEKIKAKKENNKKINFTQTPSQYEKDEISHFAKYLTKKILNKAIIQITYEQNVKQIDKKSKMVNINDQTNKQTYSNLVDYQQENLHVMDEMSEMSKFFDIFKKINIFSISRNMIDALITRNISLANERNELKKAEELEWCNEVTTNLLKNTLAYLATEKIVSFITEELVEDSFLKFCTSHNNYVETINRYLNKENISFHERRKRENGHLNFLLSNDKINVTIPVRVKEDMNLDDVLKKIKNYILKKLKFLRNEYNLNFVSIKDKGWRNILSIKDLFSSDTNEFTIYLKKKKVLS
ncbi:conserved Plasmodium protein, unknown function [Plasmodium malariae]|uniref:Uncharacterized protein n=1 Tax=Plasmodium malariae TaxID=5858 RepID=A0A1D3JJF9_PLAMA|nr:conserved Plasmodium protein, unknown function [Plasmodium malariae]SBT86576.1 conserved Plasmodium protein, unknown function [Plasmodium malariae]